MQTIHAESEELLTIDQVSMIMDIPVSTIRKYCSRYRDLMGLKRGDNNSLLFSKESIQVLVKAKDLTSQGIKPSAIKRLLLSGSKSNPVNVVNGVENGLSIDRSTVCPPGGQFEHSDTLNHNQLMDIQVVKRKLEEHLSQIEERFQEKITTLIQANESLKLDSQSKEQKFQEENALLKDEILRLKEYREADQMQASDLVRKLWETENAITELKNSQGFWATVKRWLCL